MCELKVREPGNRRPHTGVKSVISTRSAGFRICPTLRPEYDEEVRLTAIEVQASGLSLQQILLALPRGSQYALLLRYFTFRLPNRSLSRAPQDPSLSRKPTRLVQSRLLLLALFAQHQR
jgi:hypothetical protein